MTLPFDPGADFAAVVDNLQTVQYQPRTSARGGFGPTSYNATAHKAQLGKSSLGLPHGGDATDTNVVWNVQASTLEGYEAKRGDRIVETLGGGGLVYYIVDEVQIQSWIGRFRCPCHREVAGVNQPQT